MPLSNNQTVIDYFNNDSVKLYPFVAGEWNYNLVYEPYATFSGTGQGLDTSSLFNTAGWAKSNYNSSISIAQGKTTSALPNPNAIQFSVTPLTSNGSVDLLNTLNFQAQSSTQISTGGATTKCYKVVFFAKSISNDIVNLTVQANAISSPLEGGTSITLDNVDWNKVEFKIGQRATDAPFNNINLVFDMANTTLSNTDAWGVLIDHVRIYEITYFDYCYGSLYDTKSVFTYFRPGESYVSSGNSAVPTSSRLVSSIPNTWNKAMPCSPVTYSPRILYSSDANPMHKNGVLSPFSQYKYFVSEKTTSPTSIGAVYDHLLSVNKIVLKFNIGQSKPDSLIVTLTNTTTNVVTPVAVPGTWISDAGVCVLYWNGTAWTNTKWTWSPTGNNGMPHIDDTGDISMYVSGNKKGYQTVNQISVTQQSASATVNYNSKYYIGSDTNIELRRFQVIEISPRLEIDMSSFVLDFDIKKEIDNNGSPLPVSAMSANSAYINFSNIPLTGTWDDGTKNSPLSIFSTNANYGYVTPLYGMLVKHVKFYVNYYLPTISNTIIPGGTFYVDTWDNNDIKTTKVNCFDIMKFLQSLPVNDYVSESQSLTKVMTNIMDFAGFTDYDYDGLDFNGKPTGILQALTDNSQTLDTNFFFADAASKTVYDIMKEAFLAYQVGCYIDEYGVMRFKNLQNILTNYTSTSVFNDFNVVVDTYNEMIKTKIGKVLMRYRSPQIKRSVGVTDPNKATSVFQVAPDIIWQQDTEDVVPYNLLKESMSNASQNYYVTDQGSFDNLFMTTTMDHKGFCFIENEIMTTGDTEVLLSTDNAGSQKKLIYPTSQNDLSAMSGAYSNQVGLANIQQNFTGKFMNVKRGQFGTTAKPHLLMTNTNGAYQQSFTTKNLPVNSATIQDAAVPTISPNNLMQIPTNGAWNKTLVVAGKLDDNYSTYSVKFRFPNTPQEVYAGVFFGLNGTSSISTNAYFAEIGKKIIDPKTTKYQLTFYYIGSNGISVQLLQNPIDITDAVKEYFNNEPVDALHQADVGGFINLKFVNGGNGKRAIYVNKRRYLLDRRSNATTSNGAYVYKQYWSSVINPSSIPTSFAGMKFGFFATSNLAVTNVDLMEVYATESPIDQEPYYYFQTREFLNALVAGYNITEKTFFVQSRPQIFGLNMYDVQLALTPSLGAEMFKASYAFPYFPNGSTDTKDTIHVRDNALSYSNVASTGFRAKFAVANASNISVFTKTDPVYNKLADAQMLISSRGMITLTPQLTVEKIINPQTANETIEIQSNWIQSKKSADSILKVIESASDNFSKDISIQIFGNPLIQVGDVVKFSYSLKNIKDLIFFVKAVDQKFQNGLVTVLTLNEITFSAGDRYSKDNSYPSNTVLGKAPVITSISPASGLDTGSEVVTISGYNFGSDSTVLFGNNAASSVTINGTTSITATTPSSSFDDYVDVFVVSGGLASKISTSSKFLYKSAVPKVQDISNLTSTLGTLSTTKNKYPTTITWNVGAESGKNYNAYSLQFKGTTLDVTLPDTSDTGSTHTYTTPDPLFVPGETYTVIVTPLYTSGTTTYKGTPATISFTATPANVAPQPPSVSGYSVAKGTGLFSSYYIVTFNYTLGAGSDKTKLYQDYLSETSGYEGAGNATTGTFSTVSTGNHTFYIYGYNSTTNTKSSTYYSITFDPSTKVGTVTNEKTALPTPTISNLQFVVGTGYKVKFTVDVDQDTASSPAPSEYDVYVSPNVAGSIYQGADVYKIQTSGLTPSGGKYTLTMDPSPSGYGLGTTYSVYAIAVDGSGKYKNSAASSSLTVTPEYVDPTLPKSTASATDNTVIYWNVQGGSNPYSKFVVKYTDSTGRSKTDTLNGSGTTWAWASDGTAPDLSGPTFFSDGRYSNNAYFSPGSTLTIEITGYLANKVSGLKSTGTKVIPASMPTATTPVITKSYVSPNKYFYWGESTVSDGSHAFGYNWELYRNLGAVMPIYSATTNGTNVVTIVTGLNAPTANIFQTGDYIVIDQFTGNASELNTPIAFITRVNSTTFTYTRSNSGNWTYKNATYSKPANVEVANQIYFYNSGFKAYGAVDSATGSYLVKTGLSGDLYLRVRADVGNVGQYDPSPWGYRTW